MERLLSLAADCDGVIAPFLGIATDAYETLVASFVGDGLHLLLQLFHLVLLDDERLPGRTVFVLLVPPAYGAHFLAREALLLNYAQRQMKVELSFFQCRDEFLHHRVRAVDAVR